MMTDTRKPLLAALRGERIDPPPMWMMRQAGRYLPEYRELRAQKGGFLELVYDSDAAAEITLQPLRRFPDMDAAILFSDILIVPHAMGQDLTFLAGEGPHLSPRLVDADWHAFVPQPQRLQAIYDTVAKVKAQLAPDKTLLGFAGSPWTVATYMVHGTGSKDHHVPRLMAYRDRARFQALIEAITAVTIDYLCGQIDAGADAVQLFDSWAGSLAPAEFERWVIAPNLAIVSGVRARHPETPVIGFPKGAGEKLIEYINGTGIDAVGVDETIDPVWANAQIPDQICVQGNLDPMALKAGGAVLDDAIARVKSAFADRPHIFNLGHGIDKDTPIAHVQRLIALVKER